MPTCAPIQGAHGAFQPAGAPSKATAKPVGLPGPLSQEQEKKAAKVAQLQLNLQRLKHMHHAVSDDVSALAPTSAAASAPSKKRTALGQLQNDVAELRTLIQTQSDEQRRVQRRDELLEACVVKDWDKVNRMLQGDAEDLDLSTQDSIDVTQSICQCCVSAWCGARLDRYRHVLCCCQFAVVG